MNFSPNPTVPLSCIRLLLKFKIFNVGHSNKNFARHRHPSSPISQFGRWSSTMVLFSTRLCINAWHCLSSIMLLWMRSNVKFGRDNKALPSRWQSKTVTLNMFQWKPKSTWFWPTTKRLTYLRDHRSGRRYNVPGRRENCSIRIVPLKMYIKTDFLHLEKITRTISYTGETLPSLWSPL